MRRETCNRLASEGSPSNIIDDLVNSIDDLGLTRDTEQGDTDTGDENRECGPTAGNAEDFNLFDELKRNSVDHGQIISDGSTSRYVVITDVAVVTKHIARALRSADGGTHSEGALFYEGNDALRLVLVAVAIAVLSIALLYQYAKVCNKTFMPPMHVYATNARFEICKRFQKKLQT